MTLPQLTKDQWDAALAAARTLMTGDPDDALDRARFRAARDELAAVLPLGADVREVIQAAIRWNMHNDLAASLAMLPVEAVVRAGARKVEAL